MLRIVTFSGDDNQNTLPPLLNRGRVPRISILDGSLGMLPPLLRSSQLVGPPRY